MSYRQIPIQDFNVLKNTHQNSKRERERAIYIYIYIYIYIIYDKPQNNMEHRGMNDKPPNLFYLHVMKICNIFKSSPSFRTHRDRFRRRQYQRLFSSRRRRREDWGMEDIRIKLHTNSEFLGFLKTRKRWSAGLDLFRLDLASFFILFGRISQSRLDWGSSRLCEKQNLSAKSSGG